MLFLFGRELLLNRMNREPILVADSGGTGTDWCYVDADGVKTYFSGRSYHPIYWNPVFIEEEKKYWNERSALLTAKLDFFGAGCLGESNALKIKEIFHSFGFSSVSVHSDLHAAAFSLLKDQSGTFAILGTGSVAAQIENRNIFNVTGGLGHLLGDEGSGYYFGKILIQKLLNGSLNDAFSKDLWEMLGDKSTILQKVYGSESRAYLSGLSKSVIGSDHAELTKIHTENIDLFFQSIVEKVDVSNGISLVGSYAFYNTSVVVKVAEKYGVEVKEILEKPIEKLTEYIMNRTK
jgi:glucosamine kinase